MQQYFLFSNRICTITIFTIYNTNKVTWLRASRH